MLLIDPETLKKRSRGLARRINSETTSISADVVADVSRAGGGSLPLEEFPTWVVSLASSRLSAASLEARLRESEPPIIARIKEERVLLDMRTVRDDEAPLIAEALKTIDSRGEAEEGE
jgi:L-seryl-tRNA(Ser) seleniumtransferase